jgi:hypothetical protein
MARPSVRHALEHQAKRHGCFGIGRPIQKSRAQGRGTDAMTHRFGVGQLVRPRERLLENTGIYEILRLLPSGLDDEPLYRIKAATGPIQRVVREADIVPASTSSQGTG